MAIGVDGNVYVADNFNSVVDVFNPSTGTFTEFVSAAAASSHLLGWHRPDETCM